MSSADDELEYVWIDQPPYRTPPPVRKTGQGSILAAAMLAMGEILEPEKTKVVIEQADDDPLDDLPFTLDFGDLPPLN